MVALMVVALAAPGVMAADYSATVFSGQNIVVGTVNGAFGDMMVSDNETITSSLPLTNDGDWTGTVNAKFTTVVGLDYGLVSPAMSPTLVIPGDNFKLNGVTLSAANEDTLLGSVNAEETVTYSAELTVPSSQAAGVYGGTVELTFTNAP